MTLNIAQAEDAYLVGKRGFDKWREEFENKFTAPSDETQIAQGMGEMIRALPPNVLAEMEKLNPQAYREVMQKYGGG